MVSARPLRDYTYTHARAQRSNIVQPPLSLSPQNLLFESVGGSDIHTLLYVHIQGERNASKEKKCEVENAWWKWTLSVHVLKTCVDCVDVSHGEAVSLSASVG